MFKLPDCPHCHAIYRYADVKKCMNKKIHTCYHCKKSFKTSFVGNFLLVLMALAVGVLADIAEIAVFNMTDEIALFVTNIVIILIFLVFTPFFVSFKKYEEKKNKDRERN